MARELKNCGSSYRYTAKPKSEGRSPLLSLKKLCRGVANNQKILLILTLGSVGAVVLFFGGIAMSGVNTGKPCFHSVPSYGLED